MVMALSTQLAPCHGCCCPRVGGVWPGQLLWLPQRLPPAVACNMEAAAPWTCCCLVRSTPGGWRSGLWCRWSLPAEGLAAMGGVA
jgi:hypothetical protein